MSRLLGAQLLSTLTFGVVAAALGWQAYERTGSALTLGIIGLAEFLPALVFALPAGQMADRLDRRLVSATGMCIVVVVSVALALNAASGDTSAMPLYLMAAGLGVGRSFASAAFTPMLAAAVPSAALPRTMAMSSSTWQGALIFGPFIGGLLQAWGNVPPYLFAAALDLVAIALVLTVTRRVGTEHRASVTGPPTMRDATAGLRLIRHTPALLGAISLDLVAVLFGGATALLPIIASDILGVGAVGYGVLRAAPGIGAVIVGLVLAGRPIRRQVGPVLLLSVAGFGAFTILMGVSTSYWLSFAALVLLSGSDMVSVYVRSTLTPLLTPAHLRGRVVAVERVFVGASNELGAFESGLLAQYIGTVPAIVVGGGVSIGAAGLWGLFFPGLRKIDRFEDITPARDPDAPPRG
ncbi:MAG: MFS transporter [Thermoleophilia bacterium]|nr:MFS transporter [Thermoleophilia bacterium]